MNVIRTKKTLKSRNTNKAFLLVFDLHMGTLEALNYTRSIVKDIKDIEAVYVILDPD